MSSENKYNCVGYGLTIKLEDIHAVLEYRIMLFEDVFTVNCVVKIVTNHFCAM